MKQPNTSAPIPARPKGKAPKASKPAGEWLHLADIHPWDKNPRVNADAVPKVAASIREFGFPAPMVLNAATDDLVAGHTRHKAMCMILAETPDFTLDGAPGPGFVPVRRHTFRDENQAKAYAIADNRLSEDAQWDDDLLREVVASILTDAESVHDTMEVIGFDDEEIVFLTEQPPGVSTPSGPHVSPQPPPPAEGQPAQGPAFNEDVGKQVKTATCPNCNHVFPV